MKKRLLLDSHITAFKRWIPAKPIGYTEVFTTKEFYIKKNL
jgi:hypothetical protein